MKPRELLLREIEGMPEPLLAEILDFVRFLKTKIAPDRAETALASEEVLARDWLRTEEDEAWRDL